MAFLPFNTAVEPFSELYDNITKRLEYIRDHKLTNDSDAQGWLQYLIDNFDARYKAWQTSANPDLQRYLEKLSDKDTDQVVRLAGYVYLHIGLDLPMVIASALKGAPRASGNTPPLMGINHKLYLMIAPEFAEVLHNHKFRFKQGMRLWLFSKPWPLRTEAVHILVYWILTLRSVSWIHGEYISSHRSRRNPYDPEPAMLNAMNHALDYALSKTWLSVLKHLQPPIFYGLSGITIASVFSTRLFNALPLLLLLVVLILTLALVGICWGVYRYRHHNLVLELFSREIYRAVTSTVLDNEYVPQRDGSLHPDR